MRIPWFAIVLMTTIQLLAMGAQAQGREIVWPVELPADTWQLHEGQTEPGFFNSVGYVSLTTREVPGKVSFLDAQVQALGGLEHFALDTSAIRPEIIRLYAFREAAIEFVALPVQGRYSPTPAPYYYEKPIGAIPWDGKGSELAHLALVADELTTDPEEVMARFKELGEEMRFHFLEAINTGRLSGETELTVLDFLRFYEWAELGDATPSDVDTPRGTATTWGALKAR